MPWSFLLELMLLGAVTGTLAGMLGIGGGMLLVPFLTAMFSQQRFAPELVVHMAIATSLTTIVFTAASSVRAHHRRGAVLWPSARALGLGAVAGTFIGANVASRLHSGWLALFFAGFVGFSALRMLHAGRHAEPAHAKHDLPRAPWLGGAGAGIGFVSSLVGAGGGFLTVPLLRWRGVAMRNAVATSAAVGLMIALGGLAGYVSAGLRAPGLPKYALGYVYTPALLACAATSVLTAPFGASLAHRLPVHALQRVFALLLLGLASYMGYKGLLAMGWTPGAATA